MQIGKISSFGCLRSYGKWYNGDALYQINRLYYVHDGAACYSELGEERMLKAGSIYLVPATESFAPVAVGDEPFIHSYADFSLISPIMNDRSLTLQLDRSEEIDLAVRIFLLGCKRREELRGSHDIRSDGFVSLFENAVSYLVNRIADENAVEFVSDKVVTHAISIMNQRMGENITVRDIAEAVFMSEDGFIRRFSRIVGTTPYAYLKKLRLRTAESMLNGGEPIAAVAETVGYSDTSALLHAISMERKKE